MLETTTMSDWIATSPWKLCGGFISHSRRSVERRSSQSMLIMPPIATPRTHQQSTTRVINIPVYKFRRARPWLIGSSTHGVHIITSCSIARYEGLWHVGNHGVLSGRCPYTSDTQPASVEHQSWPMLCIIGLYIMWGNTQLMIFWLAYPVTRSIIDMLFRKTSIAAITTLDVLRW